MSNGSEGSVDGGQRQLFTDEELRKVEGTLGDGYVEVTVGCTSRRYGDAVGKLKVYSSGELEIDCDCIRGACDEDKLTPAEFEKHALRETAPRWKYSIWVNIEGKKVPLIKTVLLRYYDQTFGAKFSKRSSRKFHRDEFRRCSRCNKERRFRLRSKEQYRVFHDASANPNWTCPDLPYGNVTCEDDEERASRKVYCGCSRSSTCKGCTLCVCFGCEMCRFTDCSCQTCVDFIKNAKKA